MHKISLMILAKLLLMGALAAANDDYVVFKNRYAPMGFEDPKVEFEKALKRSNQEWQVDMARAAKAHGGILKQYGGLARNRRYQHEVEAIVHRLSQASHRPDIRLHTFILNSRIVNAFSTGADRVYITLGFLQMFGDEATRAFALAHEISHAMSRHSHRKLVFFRTYYKLIGSGRLLKSEGKLLVNLFTRLGETEADALGIYYLSKAGFSTVGQDRFFKWTQRMAEQQFAWVEKRRKALHDAGQRVQVLRDACKLMDQQYRIDRSTKSYERLVNEYRKLREAEEKYNRLKKAWDRDIKKRKVAEYGTEMTHPFGKNRRRVVKAVLSMLQHRAPKNEEIVAQYVFKTIFKDGYFLLPPGQSIPLR